MPLTLHDLVEAPDLDLRLVVDGPADRADGPADRAVTWVHVSELSDPTPFLSGGELLLTTGLAFDASTDADEYVRRLAVAAVVGVGFGTGLSHAEVPPELIRAAVEHALPVVEVPRSTPFIAISRAVSRAAAADEYAAVTKTFTAQQALTRAALAAAGPGRLVRLLAQQVGGWVILLDPGATVIECYPDIDPTRLAALAAEMPVLASHRGPVSSGFPLGADTVSVQSIGTGQRGRAFLAVGRPGPLTAADRHVVNAAVMLLTIRLEQSSFGRSGLGVLRSAILRLVLSGQYELAGPVAEGAGVVLPAAPVIVLVAFGDLGAEFDRLALAFGDGSRHVGSRSAESAFVAELNDHWVVLANDGSAVIADLTEALRATPVVAGRVSRVGGGSVAEGGSADGGGSGTGRGSRDARMPDADRDSGTRRAGADSVSHGGRSPADPAAQAALGVGFVGASDPTSYAEIAVAYRQARQAAEFGRRNGQTLTRYSEIAMPGIAGLIDPEQARAFAESLLAPLLDHDRTGRGDLVTSLHAWLSHHGQWDPSATALGVHRHTLRHRIRTVEELLGRSLDSPGTRSELWLALEVLNQD